VSNAVKPGKLLEQYKLLRAVINSPWVTRLDIKVTDHVIDRYFAKHGNARASLRYLEQATGAERNKIIPSLRRLTENGVISVVRQGIGTRPTEYALNFDFGAKPPSGALEGTTTSGALEGTTGGAVEGTANAPSGALEGTESYLRCRSTDRHTVSRTEDTHAAATPPPVAGEPAPAASARDPKKETPSPFDALWDAYGVRTKRADAKATYEKLGPAPELHERMVAAAGEWHRNYEANATVAKYRKRLHTWIGGEGWLEDPPAAYEDAKAAAIAKAKERGPRKAKASPSDAGEAEAGPPEVAVNRVPKGTPTGRHVVEIVNSDVVGSDLSFTYRILGGKHDGAEFTHQFLCGYDSGGDDLEIEEGQLFFAAIRKSTGIINVGDTPELHGSRLVAIVSKGGAIRYAPAEAHERGPTKAVVKSQPKAEPTPEPEVSRPEVRPQYGVPIEQDANGIWGIALARY
jgi:hypothetical protein